VNIAKVDLRFKPNCGENNPLLAMRSGLPTDGPGSGEDVPADSEGPIYTGGTTGYRYLLS